jgi:hypothetical protein
MPLLLNHIVYRPASLSFEALAPSRDIEPPCTKCGVARVTSLQLLIERRFKIPLGVCPWLKIRIR